MKIELLQASRSEWLWAAQVEALPEIAEADVAAAEELRLGYDALAEAVATSQPGSCAIQIRLTSRTGRDGQSEGLSTHLLGRAGTFDAAVELYALASTTLSPALQLRQTTTAQTRQLVELASENVHLVEIRRRVEDASPDAAWTPGQPPLLPVVLRWDTDDAGLRQAASLLARQTAATTVVLHMQRAVPSPRLMSELDVAIRDIAIGQDVASSPLRTQVVLENRRRLRDFPRAAVRLRVLVCSMHPVSTALTAGYGMALTGSSGFEVVEHVREQSRIELFDLLERLNDPTEFSNTSEELLATADVYEAGRVARFPIPAPGGSVGLLSAPLPALPRAAEATPLEGKSAVRLGPAFGGGDVSLSLRELNQHLVVCGLPGFGKTITTQSLLTRVFLDHKIPFLVIDPAKSDYTRLAGELGDNVHFYDLDPAQIAFNPFAVPTNAPVAAHAGRVLAAFDAAFQLSSVFPAAYITLARSIFSSYEKNTVPTFATLVSQLEQVIRDTGYAGESLGNIRGAVLGRLQYLTRGPLGVSLDAPESAGIDYEQLMAEPAVISLRRFAGPTERALVFGLLLAGLISYREHNPIPHQLGHITVLEEAHRLLSTAENRTDNDGVRLFVEAIAELRGSGEGFIVVDQAPTLLHPGVLKLAGSMCTHRLVDSQERLTVGAALLLDEHRALDLARLKERQIVLHSADRTASVAATVDAPRGLIGETAQTAVNSAHSLPWRELPADEDDRAARLRDRVLAASQAGLTPVAMLKEFACQLHSDQLTAAQFRSDLDLISKIFLDQVKSTRPQSKGS